MSEKKATAVDASIVVLNSGIILVGELVQHSDGALILYHPTLMQNLPARTPSGGTQIVPVLSYLGAEHIRLYPGSVAGTGPARSEVAEMYYKVRAAVSGLQIASSNPKDIPPGGKGGILAS